MADIDIDPFSDDDKTDARPDDHPDETIPLTPEGVMGGSTWEPEPEQETSFRGGKLTELDSKKHWLKDCIKN